MITAAMMAKKKPIQARAYIAAPIFQVTLYLSCFKPWLTKPPMAAEMIPTSRELTNNKGVKKNLKTFSNNPVTYKAVTKTQAMMVRMANARMALTPGTYKCCFFGK